MQIIKPVRYKPGKLLSNYYARWQNNDDPRNLGIVNFIFDMYEINRQYGRQVLIRDFKPKYGIAPWAAEALHDYFIYSPDMSKEDRSYVYATYRGGSKTFWFAFALPLYETLVGQYGIYYKEHLFPEIDYQVIKCKNATESKKRLMSISSFLNQPTVIDIFGDLKPSFKDIQKKDAKDTAELLILKNGYMHQASGIDQPIRGSNILQVRPKKITFDDPQNRENTKTPERREQCDKEVMEESFGAIADDFGSIVYIGNKVHQDDTLGKLLDEENTVWKKQFHTFSYTVDQDGNRVPGTGDLEHETPEWALRFTPEKIEKRKDWFVRQPRLGGLRGFLKEFYNIIRSDTDFKIKNHTAKYLRAFGTNWLVFNTDGAIKYVNCHIYIGNDPAISEKKRSSDSVIVALAVVPNGHRYILEYSKGKYDIHDRFAEGHPELVLAKTPKELATVKRRGNVEEIVRMQLKYHSEGIVIETAQTQSTFFNETRSKLDKLYQHATVLMPVPSKSMSKTDALRELPLGYFEAGLYHLRESMTDLKSVVEAFPDCRKDILDALYLAEQLVSVPIALTYNPLGFPNTDKPEVTEEEKFYGEVDSVTRDYEGWVVY